MSQKPKHFLRWRDIPDRDGAFLGQYALDEDGDFMTVRSVNGGEKFVRCGPDAATLAKLVAKEPP